MLRESARLVAFTNSPPDISAMILACPKPVERRGPRLGHRKAALIASLRGVVRGLRSCLQVGGLESKGLPLEPFKPPIVGGEIEDRLVRMSG